MKIVFILLTISIVLHSSDAIATMAIDLGSEFMKIAIVRPGVPMEIVLNRESQRKTPVVIAFRNGERTFGEPALNMAIKFPANAYVQLVHLLGKRLDNPLVQAYMKQYPFYKLFEDKITGQLIFQHDEKTQFSVEELVAMILENAKEAAVNFANYPLKAAVITTPPFFGQAERRALMRSAEMAGLNVLQLMNDNAAVALQHGIFRRKFFNATAQYLLFVDVGSSSTIATVASYQVVPMRENGFMEKHPQVSILGVGYDQTLGSSAFILRLRDHLVKGFNIQKLSKKNIEENSRSMATMHKEAGRIFRILSANKDVTAQIESVFDNKDFKMKVSRVELEAMCDDLFDRVAKPIKAALDASHLHMDLIQEVMLMGGGTRMPKIQERIMLATGVTELGKSINTDEAAALGAVYQAAYHSPGFRVLRFGVKDATVFPIIVDFQRASDKDANSLKESDRNMVQRVLFAHMNPYPQKKVLTFNKHFADFSFFVNYGELNHLSAFDREVLGSRNISEIAFQGLTVIQEKHAKTAGLERKGVKAHFRLDDSGLLHLDKTESHFEIHPANGSTDSIEQPDDSSTLSKIGNTISNLFGGGDEKAKEVVPEPKVEETDATTDAKQEQQRHSENKEAPDDDKSKKEEEKKKSESDNVNTTKQTDNKEKVNSTVDATANSLPSNKSVEKPAPKIIKEAIKFIVSSRDMPTPSEQAFEASKQRVRDLKELDEEKKLAEKSRNELESYIFSMKTRLSKKEYEMCSTADERNTLDSALKEASDWYDEQDESTKRLEFESRLTTLRGKAAALEDRVSELVERPKAFEVLKNMLNHTDYFLRTLYNLSGEGKVFTKTEVDTLDKLVNDTKLWQTEKLADVAKMDLTKAPILRKHDILEKASLLEREINYLVTKAKYWVPPPPPTPPPTEEPTPPPSKTTNESSSLPPPPTKDDLDKTKSESAKTTEKTAAGEDTSASAEEKGSASKKAADEL